MIIFHTFDVFPLFGSVSQLLQDPEFTPVYDITSNMKRVTHVILYKYMSWTINMLRYGQLTC